METTLENTQQHLQQNQIKIQPQQNNAECRVCLQDLKQDSLALPCKCKGSNSYIHRKCFLLWSSKTKRFNNKEDRYYISCDICAQIIYLDAQKKYRCITKEQIKTQLFGRNIKCTILTICFLLLSFLLMIIILAGLKKQAANSFQQLLAVAASIVCGVVFLIALFSFSVNYLIKEQVINYGLAEKQIMQPGQQSV